MATLYDQLLGHKRLQSTGTGHAGRRHDTEHAPGAVFAVSPCPSGLALAAVTAKQCGWEFDSARSICLGLEGPRQENLRQLAWNFDDIARDFQINTIYMREPAGTGPSHANVWTHYLVALLLLAPNLSVELIHPATIGSWLRQTTPDLPRPAELEVPPWIGKKLAFNLVDRAIECAAYVTHREVYRG